MIFSKIHLNNEPINKQVMKRMGFGGKKKRLPRFPMMGGGMGGMGGFPM